MTVDHFVFMLTGVLVVASLALAVHLSVYWVWVAIFAVANLARAAASGTCPQARLLQRLGMRPGPTFC
ncbi:MAG: DUF2892 domain-containing protein [Alphaproteobacteria bacterium]|nr:DUF2892 domain-containing protein [Alphaproteobacteria bacterium]